MKRLIENYIKKDLATKIILISGPRQCGKTTLSKQLVADFDYFNFDAIADRIAIKKMEWDRSKQLIIIDELHKMKNWKKWIKGVYDKEGIPPALLVTGSSKLDTYRKMGDSLAGRYFQFRLHPFDLSEVMRFSNQSSDVAFNTLLTIGGFPEPFLQADLAYYKRWQKTHIDIILRQDLIDEYAIRDIQSIETLIYLLQERVGSSISYAQLARDLERDPKTIKRWLTMLENLYIIFKVSPFHKNIARSLLKEPKYYFYDNGRVIGNDGAKLENLVACALIKQLNFITDTEGTDAKLYYLKTKDGKKIDFLIVLERKPAIAIEVKYSDDNLTTSFKHFQNFFPGCQGVQLVKNLSREKTYPNGFAVRDVVKWLSNIQNTLNLKDF